MVNNKAQEGINILTGCVLSLMVLGIFGGVENNTALMTSIMQDTVTYIFYISVCWIILSLVNLIVTKILSKLY